MPALIPEKFSTQETLFPELRKRRCWLTWIACAACVLVFAGIHLDPGGSENDAATKWGWQPPYDIYDGAYWALFTSAFVHIELWHLAFNLYWLYHLGRALEQAIGWWRWLAFASGAAVISSSAELAFAGTTGIGASGVVYALFGFMWILRKRVPAFAEILDKNTVLIFLIWLFVCVATTVTKLLAVGNAAHFSGLLFGSALGVWILNQPRRLWITMAIALLTIASAVSLVWAPWSMNWTSWRAVRAHENGDYAAAIRWYERTLKQGQETNWCLSNIALARQANNEERSEQ